jgi:hypothetical protein
MIRNSAGVLPAVRSNCRIVSRLESVANGVRRDRFVASRCSRAGCSRPAPGDSLTLPLLPHGALRALPAAPLPAARRPLPGWRPPGPATAARPAGPHGHAGVRSDANEALREQSAAGSAVSRALAGVNATGDAEVAVWPLLADKNALLAGTSARRSPGRLVGGWSAAEVKQRFAAGA